jgi:hypothetical protein
VGVILAPERQGEIDALDAELRFTAEAFAVVIADRLATLGPRLRRDGGDAPPEAVLEELTLDGEGEADPLTLVMCLAAHRMYVARRGAPAGVSLGALALARILAWAARAAVLGPPPQVHWIGPPSRCPEPGENQHRLAALSRARFGEESRAAQAVALVTPGAAG